MNLSNQQLRDISTVLINEPMNRSFVNNIRELLGGINQSMDIDKELNIILIERIIDVIVTTNAKSKKEVLDYINLSGRNSNVLQDILDEVKDSLISMDRINKLHSLISGRVRYSLVMKNAERFQDMITDLSTDNYEDLEVFMNELGEDINSLNRNMIRANESIIDTKYDISMNDMGLNSFIQDVVEFERSDESVIKTGIQLLNESMGGGYQKGRVYVALGIAKGWKSSFLLNSAIWAKKYNSFKTKDPSKKPVIIYLTMENSTAETIKRMWIYSMGMEHDIKNYEADEIQSIFEAENIISMDSESPEIIVWSRNNRSISTSDLEVLLEDLEKEGKEPVFLIQDYIKRIKPSEATKELRMELGTITNDFKNIASKFEIPVLTAAQMNRDAFREIQDGGPMNAQIAAIGRMGSHNVGESIDIIQNCDFAFILGRVDQHSMDHPEKKDRFLVIKNIASRDSSPRHNMFVQRFEDNNPLRIEEDIWEENHKSTIIYPGQNQTTQQSQYRNIQNNNGRRVI